MHFVGVFVANSNVLLHNSGDSEGEDLQLTCNYPNDPKVVNRIIKGI